MKVLQIHKFHTKERGGGSVTSYFETTKFLKEKGFDVIFFSMKDDTNKETKYKKYFVEGFDLSEKMSFWKKLKLLPKTIYNREAVKKIEKLILEEKPDIAHAHNIYHYLTPAIFRVLKKHNIPIVMTLHDYHMICPNYKLFVRGNICEKCKKTKYYNCLFNKCVKNSIPMSAVAMVEAYFNKVLGLYDNVDKFIAPSYFMKQKCIEFGIAENKIEMVRNNFAVNNAKNIEQIQKEKNYFLYWGRLSEEKGLNRLIEAVGILDKKQMLQDKKLYIVGRGPEEESLRQQVKNKQLDEKIKFLGFKSGDELNDIVEQSMFVVYPSIWYENAPFVVIEAQDMQKPVIVSNLGGTSELIVEGKSGVIYKANDMDDLVGKMKVMIEKTPEERAQMGKFGKKVVRDIVANSQGIINVYEELIDSQK